MALIKKVHPALSKGIYFPGTATIRVQSGAKPNLFITRSGYPKHVIEPLQERCNVESWPPEGQRIPRDVLLEKVKGRHALFVSVSEKIDKELFDAAGSQLKVVSTLSAGVDHIDAVEAKARGILVGHTPEAPTEATAELTIALLLATSRRLFEAHHEIVRESLRCWDPYYLAGPGLEKSVVGIVGFGRIGQSVARKLMPFEITKILYTDKIDIKMEKTERVGFEELLCVSDFVIANVPLTNETRNMFNEQTFSLMKPTAIFVNTARGGIVDEDALLKALEKGKLRGAGLDVFAKEPVPPDHPLVKLPNCVTLPHIGSTSIQGRTRMAETAAKNILCALDGKKMPFQYIV